MTAFRTLFLVGAVAAMGLLLIGTGVYVDYAGAERGGLPWHSGRVVRDGCANDLVDATAGEDPEDIRLEPLTRNGYQTRFSWAIVSGVLVCVGILLLGTGHFLLAVCYASRGCPWLVPSTVAGRVLLTCYLGVLYGLSVASVSTYVMGAKVSGTGMEDRLIAEKGAYYAVPRGGGPSPLRIPICGARYQERKRWERISTALGNTVVAAAVSLSLFLSVVKSLAYVRTRRNIRGKRGGSADTHSGSAGDIHLREFR